MNDPNVQSEIKTDTDNARRDLEKARLWPSTEEEFIWLWRMGFDLSLTMLRASFDTLVGIAAYCQANQGRDISRSEIVAACRLWPLSLRVFGEGHRPLRQWARRRGRIVIYAD